MGYRSIEGTVLQLSRLFLPLCTTPPCCVASSLGDRVDLPFSGQAKGVSADIDGYIWVTFQSDTNAYRIDPDTYQVETVTGLNDPYTYSDMTGGQIAGVNCNDPVE